MKNIKLIACDLDGTLLQDGAACCSGEAFELIGELNRRGILFMPASGRQYPNLNRLFAPVKDHLMYLCENGALVMYEDRVILKQHFSDELALELCHAVLEHPACEVLVSGERISYLIPKSGEFVRYMRDEVGNDVSVISRPEDIKEAILKVSYYTAPQDRDRATRDFKALFGESCDIVTSGNQWVDFAPFGTSKGNAMRKISEVMDIRPEEMAAFGDNENDRTMLEYVGHPYVMENANPTISDIPGERCKRVEDTLRMLLEKDG